MTEIMATNTVLTKSQLFLVHESQPLVNELQLRKKIEKSIELICFTTSFLHRWNFGENYDIERALRTRQHCAVPYFN